MTEKKFSLLEILQYILLISLLLYFGKTIFIPLSFSLLISFILYPICNWLEKKGINRVIAITLPVFWVISLLAAILYLLVAQMIEFSHEWTTIKIRLMDTLAQTSIFIAEKLGLSAARQMELLKNVAENAGNKAFSVIGNTASSLSEVLYLLVIVPIFASLILLYRQLLAKVLYSFFSQDQKATIHEVLIESIHTYYNFIKGMALVYLIVGILNSVCLAIIGIPHPILFGFIASILTFIPYIGIMIASLLPITVAWATYNSIWYPIYVIAAFGLVQLLEAYLIFPFAVGNRLKINTLVIFVVIVIGGILWGGAGMILFIPMISILKLIADRVEKLKTLSILLGT